MKWILLCFLIQSFFIPIILTKSHQRVKIFVPTPVQHVHHTKVVKVPEYHHYFHDRKQQKYRQPQHNHNYDSYAYGAYGGRDTYDEPNYYQNLDGSELQDSDYFQDVPQEFDDRQHTPVLPPQEFVNLNKRKQGNKRHITSPSRHNLKRNKQGNYEPQHFYHRL